MDLRRVRVDEFGLIIQSASGGMERVLLERPVIDALEHDVRAGLWALRSTHRQIAEAFDDPGDLAARIEVCDVSADCLSRPLRIYYNIEPNCNLRCAFCGPRDLHSPVNRTAAERESFLLDQIAKAGAFQVQLTGGEVFLRGRRLFHTLKRTRELGLATLLATNGVWTHIKDRSSFVQELRSFDHITEIKVSIDGTRSFHDSVRGPGTYDEAVKTLFELAEDGFRTRVNTTIFRQSCTIEQIEHVARLAKDVGASLQAVPERACGRSSGKPSWELPDPQDLRAYTLRAKALREELGIGISFNFDVFGGGRQLPVYDPVRPFSCGAGLWGVAVTHLGDVYPCGFAIEIDAGRGLLAGRIGTETSLLDLWLHSPVLKRWRAAGKPEQCRACEHYRAQCWGGCMIQALVVNGDLSALDPYCPEAISARE